MLHTLTLVVIPVTGSIPEVRKELLAQQFTIKHGTHVTESGSEAAVGVACADFHDVSVVLEKLSGLIQAAVYLVDARRRMYLFRPMRNTLDSLGYVIAHDESYEMVGSPQTFFDFGGIRWAYLPLS